MAKLANKGNSQAWEGLQGAHSGHFEFEVRAV